RTTTAAAPGETAGARPLSRRSGRPRRGCSRSIREIGWSSGERAAALKARRRTCSRFFGLRDEGAERRCHRQRDTTEDNGGEAAVGRNQTDPPPHLREGGVPDR